LYLRQEDGAEPSYRFKGDMQTLSDIFLDKNTKINLSDIYLDPKRTINPKDKSFKFQGASLDWMSDEPGPYDHHMTKIAHVCLGDRRDGTYSVADLTAEPATQNLKSTIHCTGCATCDCSDASCKPSEITYKNQMDKVITEIGTATPTQMIFKIHPSNFMMGYVKPHTTTNLLEYKY
jgi:hypothetical protein